MSKVDIDAVIANCTEEDVNRLFDSGIFYDIVLGVVKQTMETVNLEEDSVAQGTTALDGVLTQYVAADFRNFAKDAVTFDDTDEAEFLSEDLEGFSVDETA